LRGVHFVRTEHRLPHKSYTDRLCKLARISPAWVDYWIEFYSSLCTGPKARAFGRVVWDSYSERVMQKAGIFSWLIQDSGKNVARNKG
jgi:hypothetical protein